MRGPDGPPAAAERSAGLRRAGRSAWALQRRAWLSVTTDPRLGALLSRSDSVRDAGWRRLYQDERGRVARLISRRGVASADLEDVTQQVFLAAYRRLAEVAEVRNLGAWLNGIAIRTAADHRRWRRVRRANQWMVETLYGRRGGPAPPERDLEQARLERRVEAVLGRMSAKLRPVLVLCDVEELEPGEVAAILGIPVNTVRSRRRLAREAFERLWVEGRGG